MLTLAGGGLRQRERPAQCCVHTLCSLTDILQPFAKCGVFLLGMESNRASVLVIYIRNSPAGPGAACSDGCGEQPRAPVNYPLWIYEGSQLSWQRICGRGWQWGWGQCQMHLSPALRRGCVLPSAQLEDNLWFRISTADLGAFPTSSSLSLHRFPRKLTSQDGLQSHRRDAPWLCCPQDLDPIAQRLNQA